jgi:hypothetical protein
MRRPGPAVGSLRNVMSEHPMLKPASSRSTAPKIPFGERPVWRAVSARPFAVLAGMAMATSLAGGLAGCGQPDGAKSADQAAAQSDIKAAGSELKAAAVDTGAALNHAAADAKPALSKLGHEADHGLANLTDATGDAAAKAGHALDTAGAKTDRAAHRAADNARDRADNQ